MLLVSACTRFGLLRRHAHRATEEAQVPVTGEETGEHRPGMGDHCSGNRVSLKD